MPMPLWMQTSKSQQREEAEEFHRIIESWIMEEIESRIPRCAGVEEPAQVILKGSLLTSLVASALK